MTAITMQNPNTRNIVEVRWPQNIFLSGCDIIAYQTNCKGVMRRSLEKLIKHDFPTVSEAYYRLCERARKTGKSSDLLGACKLADIAQIGASTKQIAILFGQDGYGKAKQQTNYDAVDTAFKKLRAQLDEQAAHNQSFTVAIPIMMGCRDNGGGDWTQMLNVIIKAFYRTDDIINNCRHKLVFIGNDSTPDDANETFRILRNELSFKKATRQPAKLAA